jgi:hypothetical protein
MNMVEKFQEREFLGKHSGKFSGRTWLRDVVINLFSTFISNNYILSIDNNYLYKYENREFKSIIYRLIVHVDTHRSL